MRRFFPLFPLLLLILFGCANDNSLQNQTQSLNVTIIGTFTEGTEFLSVNQVAIAFDGTIVNTTSCPSVCNTLTATAGITASSGQHSVNLILNSQLLNGSATSASESYSISGQVVSANPNGVIQTVPLSSENTTISPGNSASYTVNLNP
jgi:hypothetical protein